MRRVIRHAGLPAASGQDIRQFVKLEARLQEGTFGVARWRLYRGFDARSLQPRASPPWAEPAAGHKWTSSALRSGAPGAYPLVASRRLMFATMSA